MTNERTKEFLNSDALSVLHNVNTELKLRSRTEVSKQDTNSIVPYIAQSFCKHSSTTACQCNPLPRTKIIFLSLSLSHDICLWANKCKCLILLFKPFFCPALEGCLPPCCALRWKEQVLWAFWGVCAHLTHLPALLRPYFPKGAHLYSIKLLRLTGAKWEQSNSGTNLPRLKPLSRHHWS